MARLVKSCHQKFSPAAVDRTLCAFSLAVLGKPWQNPTVRIGSAIADRRATLRLSRAGLAKLAGISSEGMRLIEIDVSSPRPENSAAIAKALQWPPDALARIAAGEDPASLPTVGQAPEPSEIERLDTLGRDIAILRGENAQLAKDLAEAMRLLRQLVERDADSK